MRIFVMDPDRPSPLRGTSMDIPFATPNGMKMDAGGEVPFPSGMLGTGQQGQTSPLDSYSAALGRADRFIARRLHTHVVLYAEGTVSTSGVQYDFQVSPVLVHPPQFRFFFLTPIGITLPAVQPFFYSEVFPFPSDKSVVVIHDAVGAHAIQIDEAKSQNLWASDGKSQTYFGASTRSIEEALERAIAEAESTVLAEEKGMDREHIFNIVESGKIRGGFAGRNLYFARVEVRISA